MDRIRDDVIVGGSAAYRILKFIYRSIVESRSYFTISAVVISLTGLIERAFEYSGCRRLANSVCGVCSDFYGATRSMPLGLLFRRISCAAQNSLAFRLLRMKL